MEKIILRIAFFLFPVISLHGQSTHELIITEILADPTPSRGLPEREYIELYNNTSDTIETSQFVLFYNNSSVRLPSYDFEPDSYLILTRTGNGIFFNSYGKTLELSQFSLLNSGAMLRLMDGNQRVSHELRYDRSWYESGKDEGYALEMIDLSFPCVGFGNWTSSVSPIGGTPGLLNSVNASKPDILPPSISGFEISDNVLTVSLSEPIADLSTENMDWFTVSPLVNIDSVGLSSDLLQISFFLSEELSDNEDFEFLLSGIQDCSGNVSDVLSLNISNRPSPKPNDILISELLFDPFPGGEDFVELKNVSATSLDLSELRFYNRDSDGVLRAEVILNKVTSDQLILEAEAVICFTRDKEFLLNTYNFARENRIIELSGLPSMPNESGEFVVADKNGEIIDEINYSSSWHYESIDDPEGVSLERIDFSKPSNDKENWQSSSGTYDFATPGFVPSRSISDEWIKVFPEIITPDNDGIGEELSIEFSGIGASKSVSVTVYDRFGGQVEKIASNLYVNQGSKLYWNGKPQNGVRLPSGYYYLFVELADSKEVRASKVPFVIAYRN